MDSPMFLQEIAESGIATLTLARPDKHNAFNAKLIADLTDALCDLDQNERVRAVVLAAEGRSFSAGADLNWMRAMADYSEEENLADARRLAELMRRLDGFSKPTVALVQGAAFGGGVGLVACCDIALASETAIFCLSEVRLGLIPAVISPYVVGAMGPRMARRYFMTAERFGALEALACGLVHEVVPERLLVQRGNEILKALLAGGPNALKEAKALIARVALQLPDDALIEDTARRIARIRGSDEAREGMGAFFDKRKPDWVDE